LNENPISLTKVMSSHIRRQIALFLFILFLIKISYGQSSVIKSFKELHGAEKCWVITHPFVAKRAWNAAQKAKSISEKMMVRSNLDHEEQGGQVDAFRHAFWMALMTRNFHWRKAIKLGRAHEKGNKKDYKKRKYEKGYLPDAVSSAMDLWNNQAGIAIGRQFKTVSENELKEIVFRYILEGKMKIIKKDSKGNFLDSENRIIPAHLWKGKWDNPKMLVPSNYGLN